MWMTKETEKSVFRMAAMRIAPVLLAFAAAAALAWFVR